MEKATFREEATGSKHGKRLGNTKRHVCFTLGVGKNKKGVESLWAGKVVGKVL